MKLKVFQASQSPTNNIVSDLENDVNVWLSSIHGIRIISQELAATPAVDEQYETLTISILYQEL